MICCSSSLLGDPQVCVLCVHVLACVCLYVFKMSVRSADHACTQPHTGCAPTGVAGSSQTNSQTQQPGATTSPSEQQYQTQTQQPGATAVEQQGGQGQLSRESSSASAAAGLSTLSNIRAPQSTTGAATTQQVGPVTTATGVRNVQTAEAGSALATLGE